MELAYIKDADIPRNLYIASSSYLDGGLIGEFFILCALQQSHGNVSMEFSHAEGICISDHVIRSCDFNIKWVNIYLPLACGATEIVPSGTRRK